MNYYDSLLESYSLLRKRKFKLSLIEEGATPEQKEQGAQEAIDWLEGGGGNGGGKNGDLTGVPSTNKENISGIEVTGGAFKMYPGFFVQDGKGWSQTKGSKKGPGNPVEAGAKANSGAAKLVAAFTSDGSTDIDADAFTPDDPGRDKPIGSESLIQAEEMRKERERWAKINKEMLAKDWRSWSPFMRKIVLENAGITEEYQPASEEVANELPNINDEVDPVGLAASLADHALQSSIWMGRDPADIINALRGSHALLQLGQELLKNQNSDDRIAKINAIAKEYDITLEDGCVKFKGISLLSCPSQEVEGEKSPEQELVSAVDKMGKLLFDIQKEDIEENGIGSQVDFSLGREGQEAQGGDASNRGTVMEESETVKPEVDKCIKIMERKPDPLSDASTEDDKEAMGFWEWEFKQCADNSRNAILKKQEDYNRYQAACLEVLKEDPTATCDKLKDKEGNPLPKGANFEGIVSVFRVGVLSPEDRWMFIGDNEKAAQEQYKWVVARLVGQGHEEGAVRAYLAEAAGVTIDKETGEITIVHPDLVAVIFASNLATRGVYEKLHGDQMPTRTEGTGQGQGEKSNVLGAKMDLKDIYCLEVEDSDIDLDADGGVSEEERYEAVEAKRYEAVEAKRYELMAHVQDTLLSPEQKKHYESVCPPATIDDIVEDLLPIEEQDCEGPGEAPSAENPKGTPGKEEKQRVVTLPREPKTQGHSGNDSTLGEQSMAKNAAAFKYMCEGPKSKGSLDDAEVSRIHDIMDQLELGDLCDDGKAGEAAGKRDEKRMARMDQQKPESLREKDENGELKYPDEERAWNGEQSQGKSVKGACDFNDKMLEKQKALTDLLEGRYVEGVDQRQTAEMALQTIINASVEAVDVGDLSKEEYDKKREEALKEMGITERELAWSQEIEDKAEQIEAKEEMDKKIDDYIEKKATTEMRQRGDNAKKALGDRFSGVKEENMTEEQKANALDLQKVTSTLQVAAYKRQLDEATKFPEDDNGDPAWEGAEKSLEAAKEAQEKAAGAADLKKAKKAVTAAKKALKAANTGHLTGDAKAYARFQYAIGGGAKSEVLNEKIGLADNRATSGLRNAEIAANLSTAKFERNRDSAETKIIAPGATKARAKTVFELASDGKPINKVKTGDDPTLMHEFYQEDPEEEKRATAQKKLGTATKNLEVLDGTDLKNAKATNKEAKTAATEAGKAKTKAEKAATAAKEASTNAESDWATDAAAAKGKNKDSEEKKKAAAKNTVKKAAGKAHTEAKKALKASIKLDTKAKKAAGKAAKAVDTAKTAHKKAKGKTKKQKDDIKAKHETELEAYKAAEDVYKKSLEKMGIGKPQETEEEAVQESSRLFKDYLVGQQKLLEILLNQTT